MACNVQANNGNPTLLRSSTGLTLSMPLTIAAKARTTVANANMALVSVQNDSLLNGYILQINSQNWLNTVTLVNGAGNFFGGTASAAAVNSWNQLATTFAVNRRVAYVNFGSMTSTSAFTNPGTVTQCAIGTRPNPDGSYNGWSTGDIAEVGIWNVALTAVEIASLTRGMTCDKIRPQNLVFYAPLVRDLLDTRGGLTLTNYGSTVADNPRIYA